MLRLGLSGNFRRISGALFSGFLLATLAILALSRVPARAEQPGLSSASETTCEPYPFVYTAEVLYGSFGKPRPSQCYPIAEAAKFDLIDTGPQSHATRRWCENPPNAFQAIKALNPRTQIVLYRMGPGQYITSTWGNVGDGWAWIKANHGKGKPDRWTALGVLTQDYLVSLPYPVERAMELGNRNWQTYWMERNYKDIWVDRINSMNGSYTDGIFADGMQYGVSWANNWCAESAYNPSNATCAQKDHPATYYQNNTYNQSLWRQHYGEFLERAVPYFRQRNLKFGLNAWRIIHPDQIALYQRLGVIAMEECGFLCTGRVELTEWEKKLRSMQEATHYSYITVNLAPGYDDDNSAQAMDSTFCAEGICQNGWKWLWYSLGSYWLAYEPQRQNAYFYFSLWEYRGSFWFDEYDPRFLHLGLPQEKARKLENGLWIREFRRGWVVVNPTLTPKVVDVPKGKARLLDHTNFKEPETVAPATQFNIPALNGVILLKEPQPPPLSCTYLPFLSR
ncbi:MAG: putative glycoside hydrolase family 15 protein [Anaerolineales bacterium]|nr:putative glycoside hydrolase family 15 protein [Anaerolineales bacterium]MDW8162242.1 putative glycoside hydrolase [Anaerolineales bacterium]